MMNIYLSTESQTSQFLQITHNNTWMIICIVAGAIVLSIAIYKIRPQIRCIEKQPQLFGTKSCSEKGLNERNYLLWDISSCILYDCEYFENSTDNVLDKL